MGVVIATLYTLGLLYFMIFDFKSYLSQLPRPEPLDVLGILIIFEFIGKHFSKTKFFDPLPRWGQKQSERQN